VLGTDAGNRSFFKPGVLLASPCSRPSSRSTLIKPPRMSETPDDVREKENSTEDCQHPDTSVRIDAASSRLSTVRPWKYVCACLLLSTLFQSIKPSDPYLPKYFIESKGINKDDVWPNIVLESLRVDSYASFR
jgi:hypothetical protein